MSQQPDNDIHEAVKFLLELVTDLDIDLETDRRIEAASRAANLGGSAAAVAALVELDESITLGPYTSEEGAYHLKIALEVAKLGDAESAVEILTAMCEDDGLECEERKEAAQEILNMGNTAAGVSGINAAFYFASEYGIDMGFDEVEYRIRAAETMAKAGNIADAVAVLNVVSENEDEKYNRSDRWNVASTLSEVGDNAAAAKAFFSLAVDDDIDADDQDRLDAALKVAELGSREMVSEALTSVAEECDQEEVRVKAAKELAAFLGEQTEGD